MVSVLPPRSRWASLAMMWVLVVLPPAARAQSAFDLLSRGPEWGGMDVPSDLPEGLPAPAPRGRIGVEQGWVSHPLETAAPVGALAATREEAAGEADAASTSGGSAAHATTSEVTVAGEAEAASSVGAGGAAPASSTTMPGPLSPQGRPGEGVLSPGLAPLSPLQPRPSFQVLPVAASLLPGLVFHGLGPWLAGDGHTAKRLFALEGTGLGLIALGGVPIAFTGASRRTIAPLYAVTLAGFSLFGISALANVYAVTAPAFDPGQAPLTLPPLELELGYQHVSDPSFDYGHFLSLGALARFDSVRLEGSARLSPDEGNTQVRLGGAYRLLGTPERARGGSDGTALDAELFGLFHRFPTEGFTLAGAEVGLRGRYAMARVSPALAGSFAEASLGAALQGYSYPGAVDEGNLSEQLLFTFGYGVWLGRGGPVKGDALLYYDHRKDGFAGGMRTRGGGVVGSFGLRGRALLTEDWGVAAEVQAGGALVGRLSLIYAVGGEP